MKLAKAIEIQQAIRQTGHYQPTLDDVAAIELLIEAGKRVQAGRPAPPSLAYLPLPGEDPQ